METGILLIFLKDMQINIPLLYHKKKAQQWEVTCRESIIVDTFAS